VIDSARFPYVGISSGYSPASRLAYLPILLRYDMYSARTWGLLDTGSAVNVLSYTVGLQLGLVWEQQTTVVHLTGNLARLPARAVILFGKVEPFPPVQLVFAWSQSEEVPIILGQVNFFAEFDVCFYGSQSAFEIKPKSRQTA
jgi:hypothetical protein